MKIKPVVLRELAQQDIESALAHYINEGSEAAARGYVDALEKALVHLARFAATGSPRYVHELNLPGLRFWPLSRFPHLVFYVEGATQIDIWRVLHGARDIPLWLGAEEGPE